MINRVIIFLFMIMPIVESLNGLYFGSGISDMYRLITIILIVFYFK